MRVRADLLTFQLRMHERRDRGRPSRGIPAPGGPPPPTPSVRVARTHLAEDPFSTDAHELLAQCLAMAALDAVFRVA